MIPCLKSLIPQGIILGFCEPKTLIISSFTIMDEEQQAVNETPVAETEVVESPSTEEKTVQPTEVEEAPIASKTEVKEEGQKVTESKPVEKRIHKLVDERNREREEKESLARQVEELTAQLSGSQGNTTQYIPQVEPGAEVTQDQYKADVVRTAQSIAQLEVAKERLIDKINKEAQESISTHPELDPKSEVFDKELSDTITESVRAQIQINPSASVKKLVNNLMKPYRRSVEKKVAETTEQVAKQVSESALRPSSVKPTEKPFESLSLKEMEAKIGVVY